MQDTDRRPPPELAEAAGWIRLQHTPGVGRATLRGLMAEFDSAQRIGKSVV